MSARRAIPADAPSDRLLVLTRLLNAPRERVFAAWTEPAHVVNWWGPHGYQVVECEADLRVGGRWRVRMRSPEGGLHTSVGLYHEVAAPERLVFTFAWEGSEDGQPGHETLVDLRLEEEAGGRTRMTFRQAVFSSQESRDGHEGGWSQAFERLLAHVEAVA